MRPSASTRTLALPGHVCSDRDLAIFLLELREYAAWLSHQTVRQRVGATEVSAQPQLSVATSRYLREWLASPADDRMALDDLIMQFESIASAAPSATITLAAPAPQAVRQQLVEWCRSQLDPYILVTFSFNSTLLGGMVVYYRSRVYDWSLRRQLLACKGNFAEVLRRV